MSSASGWWSARSSLSGFVAGVLTAVLVVWGLSWASREDGESSPVLQQDFSAADSAGLERADTGQRWVRASNGVPGAGLEIIDGRLTNTADSEGPAAGYISADLGVPVTKLSGSFQFAEGSTRDGSAAFAVFMEMLPTTPVGQSTFTSPCHLVVTPLKFDFGVANDGVITVLRTGEFAEPLEFAKNYHASVELDYENSIARIDAPDGRTYSVTDPRISINRANIATYEVYQQAAKSDDRASFQTVAAS